MAVILAPSRLDELKKRYEENPRRFFAPLANEYRKSGDLDQAIALCQEHLGDQPGNMNGQVVYGQALFDAGRYDDANTTFETALSLDPENLIALRHLGDIARLNGNATVATDWYKRVLDADPRNEEILAFIDELKAAAAPPPPAAPTPTRASTPVAPAPAVPASDAATVEFRPPTVATPTPVVPIESVPAARTTEPTKRPSLSLIDVELDLGSDVGPPPPAEPVSAPSAPVGDIELGTLDFGDAEAAPTEGFGAALSGDIDLGAPEAVPEPAPAVAEEESGLGWDVAGMVDLDAGSATPDESAPATETPQVFVTETMAELYLQQGFRDEALQVYRQLSEMNPHDESLRERIKALESGSRASMSFETLGDETPDFAPGTDGLVPINEPAPELMAAADVPIESLDFEAPVVEPAVAEIPVVEAPVVEAPVVEAPLVETAVVAEDVVALPPASSHVLSLPVVQTSARSYFASLASRRALRPDGTLPHGMSAVPAAPVAVAASADGGSIDTLFGAAPDAADDLIGQALATAVGAVDQSASVRGRPTQQANSEFSLDSVFRSEVALRTSGPIQRQSQILKFDQFFSADEAAAGSAPLVDPVPPASPVDPGTAAPADDAQFQAWLQNLKGQ